MQRRPVMVFAGSFSAGASGAGLSDGFRRLGWAVQEVDYRHYGGSSGRAIGLRIASRATRKLANAAYLQKLLDECNALRPDVFIAIKGAGLSAEFLREVRSTGAKTVMYYPDLHFAHPGVSTESFNAYDLFITTKSFQVPWLQARLGANRVAYVPHGYVDKTHHPVFNSVPESAYQTDVLYAGNHSPYKQSWLEQLLRLDSDIRLQVIGNRWNDLARGMARKALLGEVSGVRYAQAIQAAKINIAIHYGPTDSDWEDFVSTRSFEIPACGGFMLHIDNAEIREFFEPGTEIDVFSTPEELHDKIKFYLAHPQLRKKMIQRAYARCVPEYGYAQRAAQIQASISAHGFIDAPAAADGVVS